MPVVSSIIKTVHLNGNQRNTSLSNKILISVHQIAKDYTYFLSSLLKLILLRHRKTPYDHLCSLFSSSRVAVDYPIVEMKFFLTDCPFPKIFPLAQLLSPKGSERQRRVTPSCESINSWSDIHWVKNIL